VAKGYGVTLKDDDRAEVNVRIADMTSFLWGEFQCANDRIFLRARRSTKLGNVGNLTIDFKLNPENA